MKRITVEAVRAAYEKTGLKPTRGRWCDDERMCGCPIFALTCASGWHGMYFSGQQAKDSLGISQGYLGGFLNAIDHSIKASPRCDDEFSCGFADGLAVRQAIFPTERKER